MLVLANRSERACSGVLDGVGSAQHMLCVDHSWNEVAL